MAVNVGAKNHVITEIERNKENQYFSHVNAISKDNTMFKICLKLNERNYHQMIINEQRVR